MAEQPQGGAQNKLGELFVELGSKGAPTLLKQLNSVSASFLLGKNAANQFVQTLSQPFKEAGKGAVEIGKMSTALGLTFKEYMRLHLYLKSHNLSDSLISDMSSTADMLTKVSLGIGGVSGEFAYAMHRMGLSWTDYDGSFKSMIQLTKDVQKATEGMDTAQKRIMLQSVGLSSPEWQYAFERGDFNFDDYKTITDEQVNELIKSQEAIAKASAEFEQLKMHLVSKLTPAVETIANWVSDKSGKGASGEYDEPVKETATKLMTQTALNNPIMKAKILGGAFKSLVIDPIYSSNGKTTGGAAPMTPDMLIDKPTSLNPPTMNDIMPRAMGYEGTLPNLSGITQNITITNEQRIQGNNAQEIADKIAAINLQDIEYSQYQVSNLPGI